MKLGRSLAGLERHYGAVAAPVCTGPFEIVLWEIVAYLADDARRAAAFRALREWAGLTPAGILAVPVEVLREITRMRGAIAAENRAERLREAARQEVPELARKVWIWRRWPGRTP